MGKQDTIPIAKALRSAEKELTKGLLKWRLKRTGRPVPDERQLEQGSEQIVDRVHNVVKKRSRNILEEFRRAKKEFRKACRDENDSDEND